MTNRNYIPGLLKWLFVFCIVAIICSQTLSQAIGPETYPDDLEWFKEQLKGPTYHPEHITKTPGLFTTHHWGQDIDSVWGMGDSKTAKLALFDNYWGKVDSNFACFPNLPGYTPGYWDSLRTLYRTEIVTGDSVYGVSRGRFAAIMNYLALALMEEHSTVRDRLVNNNTWPDPGVPLFVTGGWGNNGHFGASLTPLPDSSLLVYNAVNPHPMGIAPGDIVLGYDGIAWKDLYPQIMAAQLPFFEWNWRGSSESSYLHTLLMGAGMNWHLFDTLDFVQYSTGDTMHLPTTLLHNQNMSLLGFEQMDIPGVPTPNVSQNEYTSFGIIDGTQIGYIYNWGWGANDEEDFENAVQTLMTDYETTGLILDLRFNTGGLMHYGQKGFELLFNTTEQAFEWLVRCNPDDHLALCSNEFPNHNTYFSYIYGAANSYYDKPIAVLVGPGARSAGDFIALVMKYHPMTRFFGKSTTAAYSGRWTAINNADWLGFYARFESYLHDNPGQYLTRSEFPVDEEVWLTQSDVAQGNDTVVEAAVAWINSQAGNQSDILCDVQSVDITLDPGEDSTQNVTISNNGTSHLFYSLTPLIDENPEMQVSEKSSIIMSSKNKSPDDKSENAPVTPVIHGQGGPDSYGYVWIDSDQPHGISPDWVDISTVGTPVILGNNSYDGPFPLGFNFQFYDSSYSEIYISSNGFLTFGSGYAGQNNRSIPFIDPPNNYIAPWWDDLDPTRGGDIYYYQDTANSRFIVSYVDVRKFPISSVGSVTCQAILYADGQIEFNYLNINLVVLDNRADIYTATIGIENIDGSDGLQIFYNAGNFLDNYSVRITTDWLAVTPASGYIAPGENVVAPVTISARYLNYGIYTGNIYLDSNDPADSNIVIPVTLTVGTGCDYVTGDVNGSDNYNGLDITYGVAFFKGGNPPQCVECGFCPDWHYCGDVNSSCNYNGLDITYGVSYFKGGAAPVPCADCPPVSGINSDFGNPNPSSKEIKRQKISNESAGKAQLHLDSQIDGVNNELIVDVKLSCDDPLAFICIPLEWESNAVSPKEIAAGEILTDWDMAWGEFDKEKKQVLFLGWNDLGGEPNPCLDTKGKMIDIFRISFTIEDDLQSSEFDIKPAVDDVNGEILLGLEDGVSFIKPEIIYGETPVISGKPDEGHLPVTYSLNHNYPNPFNARTTIEYALPEPSYVKIVIYDLLGREIETLVNADQAAGYYRANWDATEEASGIYFYTIRAGEFIETRKMLMLK